MNNRLKQFLTSPLVGGLTVIGLFSGIVYLALIEPQLPPPIKKPLNQPDFVFENVRLSLLDQGEVNWEMDSSKSVVVNDELTELYDVRGRFYRNDRVVAALKSPMGKLNMTRSDMALEKAELVFTGQGRPVTLNADVINWKSDMSQLEGRGHVRIQSDGIQLLGSYFLVDIQKQLLIVSANSSARITQ